MLRIEKIGVDFHNIRIDEMVQSRDSSAFRISIPSFYNPEWSLSSDPDLLKGSHTGIEPESDPFFSQNCSVPLFFNGRPFCPDEEDIRNFPFGKICPVPKTCSIGFVNQVDEILDIHEATQKFPHLLIMLFPFFEKVLAKSSSGFGVFRSFIEKFVSVIGTITKRTRHRILNANVGKNLVMKRAIFTEDLHGLKTGRASASRTSSDFTGRVKTRAEFRQVVMNGYISIFFWMKGLFQWDRTSIFGWVGIVFYNSRLSFQNFGAFR